MIFPKGLKTGDTIGIISPSSQFTEYSLDEIKTGFNDLGYKVKFGKSVDKVYKGYLSGEDTIRAKDIEDMFLDNDITGIICMRGGYGTPRILEMIDYNIIKSNPKFFIGFSDITALHIAFNQKANLSTVHGIMGGSILKWDAFTYKSLIDTLNLKEKLIISNPRNEKIVTIKPGYCEGKVIGGNLSLIVSTIGSEYEIDTNGKILFIEEIGEPVYKIDRMLTQLGMSGKFSNCKGIIFGDFSDCNNIDENEFRIEELLKDRVLKYNKPCIYNLKSGHCMPMISLPFGIDCKLDATNQTIEFFKNS
ncbi:MAG: LD-carboxypeptidase [Romboutsia sp.]